MPGHGPLPEMLVERLRRADLILHAGDFTTAETYHYVASLAPVEAVYGNVDDALLRATLPQKRVMTAGRFRIGLVHGDGAGLTTPERARRAFDAVDCIVFGHSHTPYLQRHGAVLLLNPGSPTDKRRAPRPSYAVIRVGEDLDAEIIYL